MTDEKIKAIYDGLNNGKKYILRKELELERELYDSGKHKYFVPEVNLYKHGDYICWRHFGSSANDNTIGGLRFILEVIFKDDNDLVDYDEAKNDKRYDWE